MTYEERVQAFWQSVEGKSYTGYELAVGLALIELWRRRGCPKTCAISNVEVAKIIGSNEKTVRRACKKLVDNCIFWRWNEKRTAAPIYCFNKADLPERWHLKKEIQKVKVTMVAQQNLFDQNKKTRADMKKVDKENENIHKHEDKPFERPTLEECVAEFLKQGSTEEEARLFFSYFDRLDWYTSNGKAKIKRLDSAVNYWLQTSKRYERTTNNRQCGSAREERNARLQARIAAYFNEK